jgi:hypothetical protein
VFTLHKICEDCVASAAIMTILTCLSVWRFLRGPDPLVGPAAAPDADLDDASGQAAQLGATRP